MNKIKERATGPNPHTMILHKVFANAADCQGSDYTSYRTPFGECYNVGGYNGWEHYDLMDEILEWNSNSDPVWFRRNYFSSTDGSCQNQIEGSGLLEGSLGGSMCSGGMSADGSGSSEEETLIYTRYWWW